MIGFRVTMSDGSTRILEADAYAVDASGDLLVSGGGTDVLECRAGDWVMVDALGARLAREWPPDDLDCLVDSVAEELAVRFGHYVYQLRERHRFGDWRMNDLDALSEQLLAAVGIDAVGSSQLAEVEMVRGLVTRHFGLETDQS